MDDNLILVAAIAGALFLMFRRRRRDGGAKIGLFNRSPPRAAVGAASQAGRAPGTAPQGDTMPRIGTPHTVTLSQLDQLEQFNFPRERSWSREEADLIIDSVVYLRGVCKEIIDEPEPELAVQNRLLRAILGDQDLRDYVRAWGERRRTEGLQGTDPTPLPRNNQFARVAAALKEAAKDA
jgi:hypothetical protein